MRSAGHRTRAARGVRHLLLGVCGVNLHAHAAAVFTTQNRDALLSPDARDDVEVPVARPKQSVLSKVALERFHAAVWARHDRAAPGDLHALREQLERNAR